MNLLVLSLVLVAAAIHATWNAMLKTGADRVWWMTMLCLASGVLAALVIPFVPLPAPESWPYIAGSAVIHVAYQFLLVNTYSRGEFSQTYPIARGSAPMLVALGGFLVAGEALTLLEVLGIATVSAGIIALAFQNGRFHAEAAPAALATGFCIALYSVVDGIGGRVAGGPVAFLAWMTLLWSVVIVVIYLWRSGVHRLIHRPARDILAASSGGVIASTGYGIIIWAMTLGPMGPVSALRETSVVFAALIARLFMNERASLYRVLACVTVAFGAACLALG